MPPEARANIEKWKQQTSIPGIFGTIDCTHIAIKKPCEHGQDYFNRKSHYSVNIQGSNLYPGLATSRATSQFWLVKWLVDTL